jgi:hypothetical protein
LSLKSEAQRFLEKSARPPYCEELFKVTTPSCMAVGNLEMNSQWRTQQPFIYLYTTDGDDGAMNKFGTCSQWRMAQVSFYNLNVFFSLVNGVWMLCDTVNGVWTLCDIVNGAMNTPRYWQQRDDACSHVGTSVNTLVASEWGNSVQPMKKPAQMPPILQGDEWISFPRWECVFEMPTALRGGAESLKGSHRMLDFSKNPRAYLFIKGLLNEPNFSRIHLTGQYL